MAIKREKYLSLLLLSLLILNASPNTVNANGGAVDFFKVCGQTPFPDVCQKMVSESQKHNILSAEDYTTMGISITFVATRQLTTYLTDLTANIKEGFTDPRTSGVLYDCLSLLKGSTSQLRTSVDEMNRLEPDQPWAVPLSNVETWMGAALMNDETCLKGLTGIQQESPVKTDMFDRVTMVKKYTSVALVMVKILKVGDKQNDTGIRPPVPPPQY
ncbi:hypothetical protein GIB67_006130 [Kingdonia uniflora]|uniref:Pectinesterase inhibitor domain-containing protein n=1 Tax=Kingdonia uniflora TaxID=39325 RepID=A0A7J7LQ16_9MAGN|nr:hypothetical protein GIB67_006130 [Kingdonia uniflora]